MITLVITSKKTIHAYIIIIQCCNVIFDDIHRRMQTYMCIAILFPTQSHQERECQLYPQPCGQCGELVVRRDLDQHLEETCSVIKCRLCHTLVSTSHTIQCCTSLQYVCNTMVDVRGYCSTDHACELYVSSLVCGFYFIGTLSVTFCLVETAIFTGCVLFVHPVQNLLQLYTHPDHSGQQYLLC